MQKLGFNSGVKQLFHFVYDCLVGWCNLTPFEGRCAEKLPKSESEVKETSVYKSALSPQRSDGVVLTHNREMGRNGGTIS